jgi:hypothetical protein
VATAAKKKAPAKPAPKKPRATRHDWVEVKRLFVEGMIVDGKRHANPSLGEVAAHFKIDASSVRRESMREKWIDQRDLFQKRLDEAQREKTTKILASKGAEFDAWSLRIAEKVYKVLEARLDKALADKDAVEMTPTQASHVAAAVKGAQYVGRLVMGDSTDNARLYAELLQKPDLSNLSPAELEQLETILGKARPAAEAQE